MDRLKRNLQLAGVNIAALAGGAAVLTYVNVWERISVASAWLCMVFLSAALLIGPLRRAAGQPAPANIYLRRDLGIWAGLQGLLHSYAGTAVSMNQSYMDAFVNADAPPLNAAVRYELFFWSGTGAFVVSLLFIFLLLISSDRALRWLGVDRWKKFQRSAYVALWLTVLHGLAFQILEGRYLPFAVFAVISLGVFWLQFRGRRRSA